MERILCAAVWHREQFDKENNYLPVNINTGTVVCGYRHDRCISRLYHMGMNMKDDDMVQGFLTSKERFVGRKEASKIAKSCGQIDEDDGLLFSEDLY